MLTFPVMAKKTDKLTGIDADIARNIDRFILESGMRRKDIAEKMGLDNPSMVSQYRHGHKAAGKNFISKLAKALGRKQEEFYAKDVAPSAAYSDGNVPPSMVRETTGEYISIPIVDAKVAAGAPDTITAEQIVDTALIHRHALHKKDPRGLVCTFVKGDSMEPVLRDGAVVCIDTKARPEGKKVPAGSIWAVRKDEGVVVKYLQIRDSTFVLVSANKSYLVELVKDPEAIIGKVIWAWQSFS